MSRLILMHTQFVDVSATPEASLAPEFVYVHLIVW
jgi:hypothetical protein